MDAYILEWGSLLLRWLHIVTAIAWIGSSFFFMHLDASLRTTNGIPVGQGGAAWQVHGGGFYEMRKHLVAPQQMPEELTWHKWQSYWTWISGFFLLCWIYYGQSQLYLINPSIMQLTPFAASAIGLGGLAGGWLFYDTLCKSKFGRNDVLLAGVGFLFIVAASYGFSSVFSGRGALIHTGALMATIMSANVFLIIIPNQKKVVAALIEGRTPDPRLGKQAKQRSVHNNYLTLPVVFFMISNHYPVTYANSATIPLIVALVVFTGAVVRHFFNVYHTGHRKAPWWAWFAATCAMWTIFWVAMASSPDGRERLGFTQLETPAVQIVAAAPPAHVTDIIVTRCSMCHTAQPVWPGIQIAPKNVVLDSPESIARQKHAIGVQAVMSHAMPPNNVTEMTAGERSQLKVWFESATINPGAMSSASLIK